MSRFRKSRSLKLWSLCLAPTALMVCASKPALAAPTCPAPESPSSASAPAARSAPSARMSPVAREMAAGDALYDQGRYQEAAAAFTRLAARPADRANTAVRAKIRLSRTLLKLDQHQMAADLASQARRQTADPSLRRQADFLLATARFQEGSAGAETAYDAAERIAATGDYAAAEAAFSSLLQRPCPVRADFYSRVGLRLTNLAINRDDLATARQRLAAAGPFQTPELQRRATELEGRIAQHEVDMAALAAAAAADAQVAAGDVAGALATRQAALQSHPGISQEARDRISFDIALDLARLNRFDEANAMVTGVQSRGLSPEMSQRATAVLGRIYDRQLAFRANTLLRAGDVLRDQGRPRQALAVYDTLSKDAAWPLEWRQRADLRSASLLRDYNDFRAARMRIASVSGAPATDDLRDSAQRAAAAVEADTPLNSVRGSVFAGLRHDTNPLAETTAIRGEEDDALTLNDRGEDSSVFADLAFEYRRRLNDRYDYFRLNGELEATRQESLTDLDRLAASLRAGPVWHVQPLGSTVSVGVLGGATWRGGKYLYDDLGGYAEYGARVAGWRVVGNYDLTRRDDRRQAYDGWRHRIEVNARPANGTFGPRLTAELGRDDLKDGRNSANIYGVGGAYRWRLGGDERLTYALEASASYRRVEFDDARQLDAAVFGARRDNRVRAGLALEVVIRSETVVRLEYSHLDIGSNERRRDLDNDRVAISIGRRF